MHLPVRIKTGDAGDARKIVQIKQLIPDFTAIPNMGAADRAEQDHRRIENDGFDKVRFFGIGLLK